ncbi:MAG: TRAP transporter small permease [Hyphomicrobiaceae bacterium]
MSLIGGYLAAIALVAMLLLVMVEIVIRGVFGQSTQISDEFSGYFNAALIFLGLGLALKDGQFIRIEFFYARMRGRIMRVTRWFILLCSLSYVGVLLYYILDQITYLYSANIAAPSTSQIPLYLPQLVMPIGSVILLLQLLVFVFRPKKEMP